MFCFAFLASMPGMYRKKCKACQHVNSKKCKRCGGALDIQSPGRPRAVRAMECQLFMWPALMAMNRATPSTRLQV